MSLYTIQVFKKKNIKQLGYMNVTYQTTASVAPTAQTEDELGAVRGGATTSRIWRGLE